jgi:hypothetical protein
MDRLLDAVGIDPVQWRALTRAYLVMDARKTSGTRASDKPRRGFRSLPYAPLLFASVLSSVMITVLVLLLQDPLTAAFLMVTMAAVNSSMLLLLDFTGFVVSTDDYWIIAPRPITSRTYFAARIASVLTYISAAAVAMSILPALAFLLWHRLGLVSALAAIGATTLCCVAAAGCVITAYTSLVTHVHPRRLARALSSLQLLSSALSLGGYLVVIRALEGATVRDVSIGAIGWVWYLPTTWFAAMVPALAGLGGSREWLASAAALGLTLVALVAAAGRVTLRFAERLADASTSGEQTRGPSLNRIPGFREGEAYAIATLLRAQFRYDTRFRLGILSILPVTVFYMFLGMNDGGVADPFNGRPGGMPVYMAVTFLPMTLHSSIRYSEHWRASWIFFAAPADAARLLVAAKNFVAIFFLGAYLVFMAAVWAYFYDRVWHAVVHAMMIGAVAHMLLQLAVILSPALPFASEPKQGEQSGRLFTFFFLASLAAGIGPLLLPFIYRSASWTIILALLLAGGTAALELLVRRRAREEMLDLEFR